MMRTGNPALSDTIFSNARQSATAESATMTIAGTVNKTGALLVLTTLAASWSWSVAYKPGLFAGEAIFVPTPFLWGGAIAGLVAITPASGYVDPAGALAIGVIAGLVCYWGATSLKHMFGYDDSLDVFAVHGLGGITGAVLTGVFAVEAIGGTPGGLEGNWGQVLTQIYGVGSTIMYCGVATFVLLMVIKATMGIRVEDDEERQGLDIALHGESVI